MTVQGIEGTSKLSAISFARIDYFRCTSDAQPKYPGRVISTVRKSCSKTTFSSVRLGLAHATSNGLASTT